MNIGKPQNQTRNSTDIELGIYILYMMPIVNYQKISYFIFSFNPLTKTKTKFGSNNTCAVTNRIAIQKKGGGKHLSIYIYR